MPIVQLLTPYIFVSKRKFTRELYQKRNYINVCGLVMKKITSLIILNCLKYNYIPLVFFIVESFEIAGCILVNVAKIMVFTSYIMSNKFL